MSAVLFKAGLASSYAASAKEMNTFYYTTDDKKLYLGTELLTDHANVEEVKKALEDLTAAQVEYKAAADGKAAQSVEAALNELYEAIGGDGAVADQIKAAIEALDATVTIADEDNSNPLNITIVETDGKLTSVTGSIDDVFDAKGAAATAKSEVIGTASDAKTADTVNGAKAFATDAVNTLDGALEAVAKSGAASDVSVADAAGKLDATNVEDALAEILTKINSASDDAAVTVEKTTGGEDDNFVTKYTFKQGGTPIANGEITIAKDMVATAGELVDEDDKGTKGTFIKMTIANGTPFYINVADLIEYNAVASTDEITLTDNNHTISATVGKIAASKIVYKAAAGEDPEQTVAEAINALEAASTTGVDNKIAAAIEALDADVDATGTAQHDGVFVVSGVTEADGKLTAVDSVEVDPAGAAATAKAEVIGTGTGRSGAGTDEDPYVYADTVKGAKTYAKDLADAVAADAASAVADLDVNEFALATVASNVVTIKGIKETDGKIEIGVDTTKDITLEEIAMSGAAADVSIADSDNHFTGTTVEAALGELAQNLTWQSI